MLAIALVLALNLAAGDPLVAVQTIPLPNVEGRIDHLAVDLARKRLYVAALGNGTVEVINLDAGKVVDSIKNLNEPQGVAVIPATGFIAVGVGGEGTCRLFQPSLAAFRAIHNLPDADNVRYDATASRIYVGYGDGALAVIDPAAPALSRTITLKGHPESFQLEQNGDRIFINVPDAKQVAVAERTKGAVVAEWPIENASANFPMALDEKNHRLFVGCRQPAILLVLDTETGAIRASVPCVGDTDDIFYDAARARVYVIGGGGKVSVFSQTDADHYAEMAAITTAPGARTGLFVPDLNRLYVAVPHRDKQPAELRIFEAH